MNVRISTASNISSGTSFNFYSNNITSTDWMINISVGRLAGLEVYDSGSLY